MVRQGQTDWNLHKKFNGITETTLNQIGVMQASRQADNLRHVVFDACFTSPQHRALQTCEIIWQGACIVDDRLAEINCGTFEGTAETADSMQQFWHAVRCGEHGTEHFAAFVQRNCAFCDMIAQEYTGCDVLIVTHAANVRVLNYYFLSKPAKYDFSKPVSENGGLLTYDFN